MGAEKLLPRDLLNEIENRLEEENNVDKARPEKKRRRTKERQRDFWGTVWGKMLRDPRSLIDGTPEYKDFRRTFRMPAPLFVDYFMPEVQRVNLFDVQRESAIPLEIKCMIEDWVGMDPDANPVVGDDVADPELNNDIEPGIQPEDPVLYPFWA